MRNHVGFYFLLFISLLILGCSDSTRNTFRTGEHTITLIEKHDSLYYIQIASDSLVDNWKLPYPVYQFTHGDVDGNGKDDILVGVIKTTRFDSIKRKRLFIFKNYNGYVRPLWLGSRLSKPLVDFDFIERGEGNFIRSIEKEQSGKVLIAEYKWKRFGLAFTKYLHREIDSVKAVQILRNKS